MATFYLDYELGSNAGTGADWANAWKTITLGATAARIAPGDIIRIAKSPAPTALAGTTATWNDLSKTVTLTSAETANIDLVETNWTAIAGGDTTPTLVAVTTDAKQGAQSVRLTLDAAPQASVGQAFFATGTLDLSAYQKISFWIKNSAAIVDATTYTIRLCSDTAGAITVDTFVIPAIPSASRWLPLTLTKSGGGNLGNAIASIAVYTGATIPTASSNILIDNFIACTTAGLNLQSLISKNSAEQGGTEGWYGIQSINGVTVLLDNSTNTLANAGRGYSGATGSVNTFKRETIKTVMVTSASTAVQALTESGTIGSNTQFQGGWNVATTVQEGETFFDGLNGFGFGLDFAYRNFNTINLLNFYRYGTGVLLTGNSSTLTSLSSCNNTSYGLNASDSLNFIITTINNANNNGETNTLLSGIGFSGKNDTVGTVVNANNNIGPGIKFFTTAFKVTLKEVSNARNNGLYGVFFGQTNTANGSSNNYINSLSTSGNSTGGVGINYGINYLSNALIAEATEVSGYTDFANSRIFSNKHDQTADNHWIFTDGGTINSQTTIRKTASGVAWKLSPTSSNRSSTYPLDVSIAKIAVAANALVTVKCWFYKSSAAGITAKLVCRGGQIAGVASNVEATAADVLNTWEELTITFTPTEAGVVEIEAWAYGGTAESVYVDDMTITQA